MLNKIKHDLASVKLWVVIIATVLVCLKIISDVVWGTLIGSLFVMREASELRHDIYGSLND